MTLRQEINRMERNGTERDDILRVLAGRAAGLLYDGKRAQAIMDHADWADYYPEIEADGRLTGKVIEMDHDEYRVVADSAMILCDGIGDCGQLHADHDDYALYG